MDTGDDVLDPLKILPKVLQLIQLLHQAADAVPIEWFEVGIAHHVLCQRLYRLVLAGLSL